jgi:3-phenylpropionate/cinnamic acid dioxygenase small subunit
MTDERIDELARRIAGLEAREAVTRRYFHYAWLVDSRNWNRVADEIFAPDAELSLGTSMATHRGREAISRSFSTVLPDLEGTAHYFTNIDVEVVSDTDARARAYFQSFHWALDTAGSGPRRPVDFVGSGVYFDEWRKEPEGWRIVQRRRRNLGPGPLGFGQLPASLTRRMRGWGGSRDD